MKIFSQLMFLSGSITQVETLEPVQSTRHLEMEAAEKLKTDLKQADQKPQDSDKVRSA